MDLWAIKKQEAVRPLGQLTDLSLNGKDRVHVDLRISKPQGRIALYLDDTPVKEWDDPEGFIGQGTGIRFVQNPGSIIKLSNLRVTHWDGVFGETAADAGDVCWLEDGQKIAGAIESINNGKVDARAAKGPIDISIADVKAIHFTPAQASPPQIHDATVRGAFAQGGSLTFDLETWRPGEMVIRSPDFGKARINPAAFTRLQFLFPEKKAPEGPKG